MREIKLRYVFRRKEDGHIYMVIVPLGIFEDGHGEIFTMFKNELWELISRDVFTGLLDKNGKEIYEGDIVEFDKTAWGGNDNIHLVSWDAKEGRWDWGGGVTSDMNYRRVIGSIHEAEGK